MSDWTGRRVLVTGVCGTVGREILRQLVTEAPTEIIGIDNNESELFFLQQETSDLDTLVTLSLGDVRDAARLHRVMEGVDTVLHAAALKHVHLCEQSPRDAIQTNVLGAQNIVDAAEANGVERVIMTSSDKAVNPTSVMGTSKLMGERLFTAAYLRRRDPRPIFASTRFGNVLGSRGSVIPLFHRQVRDGGPVTITDLDMTRFIMSLREAVKLTMDSVFLAQGGEVFVTKMQVLRIEDLAYAMIEELAPLYGHAPDEIRVEIIGAKMEDGREALGRAAQRRGGPSRGGATQPLRHPSRGADHAGRPARIRPPPSARHRRRGLQLGSRHAADAGRAAHVPPGA